jgi:hypothetical protein
MQLHLHRYNTYILRMEALLVRNSVNSFALVFLGSHDFHRTNIFIRGRYDPSTQTSESSELSFFVSQYWRDIPSTVILLFGLTSAALWFACVPNNYTFALGSLYAFSRPIRLPIRAPGQPRGRRSMGDTLLDQWLDGIPLEGAPTHRDVAVAVQRTLVASSSIP